MGKTETEIEITLPYFFTLDRHSGTEAYSVQALAMSQKKSQAVANSQKSGDYLVYPSRIHQHCLAIDTA